MKYIQETVVGQNGKKHLSGRSLLVASLECAAYETQMHRYTLVETRIMLQAVVSAARIC